MLVLNTYVREAEALEDWAGVATAQSLMARNYDRKRNSQLRLSAAHAALATIRQHLANRDTLLADALKAKGDALIRLTAYDSSIYYLKQAEALYLKQKNWGRVASCRVGTGSNLYRLKRFASADTLLSKTRDFIEEKLDPLPGIYGTVLNLLGAIYNNTGDYEKALDNAIKSVRFRESQTSSGQRLIYAYNNLGIAYMNRADYDQAEEVLERAELVAKEDVAANARPLVSIYNNLMLINLRKKDYPNALVYGSRRAKMVSDYKVKVAENSEIIFYNNLALTQLQSGELNIAKAYLDQYYQLNPESRQTLSNLGYYYHQLKKPEEAARFLNLAINSFKDQANPEVAKLYRYMAEMAALKGDQKSVSQHYQKSISILVPQFNSAADWSPPPLTGIRSKRELLKTLVSQARYLETYQNNPEALTKTVMTAVALVDSMYYEHKAEGSRVFLKSEAVPLYELSIKTLIRNYQKYPDASTLATLFNLFEKGKSSLLSDLLQIKNANLMGGVPAELIEAERTLEIDIAFYESELYKARLKGDDEKSALYNGYRLEKTNELDRLKENFKVNYPKYYLSRHGRNQLNLAQVQEQLADNQELLIDYFVGENAVYAMAVTAEEVVIKEIPESMTSLRSLVIQYISTINSPSLLQTNAELAYERLSSRGQKLFQELLMPLLSELEDTPQGLYIVPDGFLNYLPFETLITGQSKDKTDFIGLPYLIKQYPIRYSYSASLPQAETGVNWGKTRVLGMAPFSEGNLPQSGEEIGRLNQHFSASLFQGQNSTKGQFHAVANDYEVLHLATHGNLDQGNPALSHLSFAADSSGDKLHVYELENMDLKAKLAILSACETGTGQYLAGEGVMSLARGFTYAGVPSVLMSLWKVDDNSGTDLISGFYQELSAETNKAVALRTAKLNYLNNADQLHAHPYFWSQFVLIGDPAPLKSIPTWQLWLTLAGLVLLGGFTLMRRRARRKSQSLA